jgi:hypothetical protein
MRSVGFAFQFAQFASPQFSKQERVSGVSAVSAVSAARRFAPGRAVLFDVPHLRLAGGTIPFIRRYSTICP